MEWPIIVAIAVGVPIILLPAAIVWFVNVSGIYTVIRETRRRRVAREKRMLAPEPAES